MKKITSPCASLDWKGGIQDWFCGCNNDHNGEGISCSDVHETSHSYDARLSNKKLHEKTLGPNSPHDILHSTSFMLLSSKLFDEISDNAALKCKSCHSVIGELQIKQNCVRIWHHSLNFNEEATTSILPEAEETFLLLIGGICIEHAWMPIKINLTAGRKITLLKFFGLC